MRHFHICHTAFWRHEQALHVSIHIHHHPYTLWVLYEPTSLSNIHRGVYPCIHKHYPVYYYAFIPHLLAYGISEAVTSAGPGNHSKIIHPPSPAPVPRQLLLSSLQSVCKSLCEFNFSPGFMVLPISWRLPRLEMPEASAHSASETPDCSFMV